MTVMTGKRELAARVLERCAGRDSLGRWRSWWQRDLPVLAYHRVSEIEDERDHPFDPEEVSASPAGFREQMQYVARHFDPITLADLAAALDGHAVLPPRPLIVTFDDGYADNYTDAFPILRDTGVPATVFAVTGHLGTSVPFWYDRLVHSLLQAPCDRLRLPGSRRIVELGDAAARRRVSRQLIAHFKRVPDAVRRRQLEEMAGQLPMQVRQEDLPRCRAMTWDEAREMSAGGIEFGSHTVSHPVLSRLDPAALRYELRESKRRLEEELGVAIVSISFPFGGAADYDEGVLREVRRAGYAVAASYVSGTNDRRDMLRYELRRLHVERYTTMSMFTSMLAVPQLFAG